MLAFRLILDQAARRAAGRLEQLAARLDAGDEQAWPAFLETARGLAEIVAQTRPERQGALLTTQEMADRLGVSPKTLLKHKARGVVRPAAQKGKWIRWRGDEVPR
jgi:hypothetical protein